MTKTEAREFVQEYIALCEKFKGEIVVNAFGVHTVQPDEGKAYAFATVYPEWNDEE